MTKHHFFILCFKGLRLKCGAIFDGGIYKLVLVHLIENGLVEIVGFVGLKDHGEMVSVPDVRCWQETDQ